MNIKRFFMIAILVCAFILGGVFMASPLPGQAGEAYSLAGAWVASATFDEEWGGETISSPAAFTKDGLIINTNPGGYASIGVWERKQGNQYSATFTGNEIAEDTFIWYKIRATVELSADGEEFSGRFANEITDEAGNYLFTVTGKIEGKRIHVEPLE